MTSALEDKIRPAAIAVEKQVKCICISNARVEVKYVRVGTDGCDGDLAYTQRRDYRHLVVAATICNRVTMSCGLRRRLSSSKRLLFNPVCVSNETYMYRRSSVRPYYKPLRTVFDVTTTVTSLVCFVSKSFILKNY